MKSGKREITEGIEIRNKEKIRMLGENKIKALYCGIVVNEFDLQSRCHVHARTNTLGKGMNPLILSMG